MGEFFKLDSICAVTDVNRLGQSRATQLGHDLEQLASRWRAFGWHAIIVDGHDVDALLAAYAEARATKGQPTMILARTLKGKGISFAENKDGWHGKALKKGDEENKALARARKPVHQGCRPARPDPDAREEGVGARPQAEGAGRDAAAGLQAGRSGRDARGLRYRARQARRARPARRRARLGRRQLDLQRQVREAVPGSLLPGLHRRAGDDGRRDGPRQPRLHRLPVDVRVLPEPRLRLRPHGQHQHAERQDGRLARRRLDRRGRPVADGARGSGDDARHRRLRRLLSVGRGQHRATPRP